LDGPVHALGDSFNALFDGVNAALWRLLELPIFVLLLGLAAAFAVAWLVFRRAHRRLRGAAPPPAALRWAALAFFVLAAALVVDHKIVAALDEVRAVRSQQLLAPPSAPADEPAVAGSGFRNASPNGLYDDVRAAEVIAGTFGGFEASGVALHPGIDFVVVRTSDPGREGLVVHAFVGVVDLTHPDLEVEITPALREKYFTSEFARATGSLIAINGEAGTSPDPGSGFGNWVGHWIVRGEVLASERDGVPRPYLAFDRNGRAQYVDEQAAVRAPPDGTWNAIWGRWTILRDGENLNLSPTSRKPRTLMGIDRSGERLVLVVIAGGRPGFSLGTGLADAATLMQAFGAWNAMACDEGGSSAMYLARDDAIVSGLTSRGERITYTHFGVSSRN